MKAKKQYNSKNSPSLLFAYGDYKIITLPLIFKKQIVNDYTLDLLFCIPYLPKPLARLIRPISIEDILSVFNSHFS